MSTPDSPLQRAIEASVFVAESLQRHPEWLAEAGESVARAPGHLRARVLAAVTAADGEAALMRELRQLRTREMTRIAVRALTDRAALAETLDELSELAEACCSAAVDWCLRQLCERHGRPRGSDGTVAVPVVLGMGKLGGGELNFSSDIDLIFLHSASGDTDGHWPIENERFFLRLAQDVIRVLATQTEHGFVFRVDTLLRPFGSAGPMSISFDAAEDYYQNHGREWERYALIKARPVAGDRDAGQGLLRSLRPFVYRRYLDYNAPASLRELKRRIHGDVVARRLTDDVKLGPGGIREIEFIVQSFQLVRGGHDARLRDPRLRVVLAQLGAAGLMDAATVQQLDAAYVFLRRLENAIQMYADRQTHRLPAAPEERAALCRALDEPDWECLRAHFDTTAAFVNGEFRRVFAEPGQEPAVSELAAAAVQAALDSAVDAAAVRRLLIEAGLPEAPDALAQRLMDLLRGRLARGLSEATALRLHRVLVNTIESALGGGSAAQTLERVLLVLQAVAGRSTYLALLDESAVAREHLVRLCAASRWVAEQMAASPSALDTLLDPRILFAPPGRERVREELDRRLAQIDVADVETGMDVLRRYRNEVSLRIAAADVAGSLPLVKVSDQLTWLAEAVVAAAVSRAIAELEAQYGHVPGEDAVPAGLGVIAYGKFGGIELGYGSDLDLVFVYEPVAVEAESRGGARSLPAAAYFSRLAQRVIHWLSTLTPAGRAYEVDMALRPSGESGAVTTGFPGFARYQRGQAWTWEHQALTRSRCVAGPERLRAAVESLRREVLCRERDPARLAQEIIEMRQKMRTHLEKRSAARWDLKQGEGGVIDCEFLTQYLVLRDAHRHPELVQWSDNWRQLDVLAEAGSIERADKDRLIECYRAYRAYAHACALQSEPALTPADAFVAEREAVRSIWNAYLGV